MGQRLGQHFLIDKNVLQKIADAVPDRPVIEIGPGHGELTELLLAKNPARTLIAVERDPHLAILFKKRFDPKRFPNTALVEGDVRRELPALLRSASLGPTFTVAGNIPYYLSGFLLRILGESDVKPTHTILTVQKEVAERASASPPQMTLLSASIQIWATPSVLFVIPPEAFSPPPKVYSAVLWLVSHTSEKGLKNLSSSFPVIRALFRQPRKKAISNLVASYPDKKEEIVKFFSSHTLPDNARPQEFGAELISLLAQILES